MHFNCRTSVLFEFTMIRVQTIFAISNNIGKYDKAVYQARIYYVYGHALLPGNGSVHIQTRAFIKRGRIVLIKM